MLILGLESSAKAASAALCRDGEVLGLYTQCSGLTHSRTLLPMVEDLLKNTETQLADVDAVAVARGPEGPVLGRSEAGHRGIDPGGHGLERHRRGRRYARLLLHGRQAPAGL